MKFLKLIKLITSRSQNTKSPTTDTAHDSQQTETQASKAANTTGKSASDTTNHLNASSGPRFRKYVLAFCARGLWQKPGRAVAYQTQAFSRYRHQFKNTQKQEHFCGEIKKN